MHLVCSSPLSGSALSAVQNVGGDVNAFGYPASASFTTANIQSLCNTWGLPLGNGNNAMGLTYNGQLIDAVRASCPGAKRPLPPLTACYAAQTDWPAGRAGRARVQPDEPGRERRA
jgi:hypothetical protein